MKILGVACSLFVLFAPQEFRQQESRPFQRERPAVYFPVPKAPPAPAQAVPPVTLGGGTDQTLLVDEFGDLNVTWYGTNHAFMFTRSTDQGMTWSAPVTLPAVPATSMSAFGPSVAIEFNGTIDALYLCGGTTCPGNVVDQSLQLIRSADNGATWSNPVDVSLPFISGGFGAQEPAMAACGAGVAVAWQDDGVGSTSSANLNPDIMFEYIVGGVPQKPSNLSSTPEATENHPQIAVNPQGTVFVTWVTGPNAVNGSGGPPSIVFSAIPDCGAQP
jgi:hypothetical protein